jgi:hypothetical protein
MQIHLYELHAKFSFSCKYLGLIGVEFVNAFVKKKLNTEDESAQAAAVAAVPSEIRWTRENVIALAKMLRTLKVHNKIKFRDVVLGSGVAVPGSEVELVQQKFSRWINNAETAEKWRALKESDYRAIVSYLQREDLLVSSFEETSLQDVFPDAMFHATAQWLGMRRDSHAELRTCFPGRYKVYRHSLLKPGYIIVGQLDIEYDKASRAVKTTERYTVDPLTKTSATNFEMSGYLFRRNNRYRILSKHIGTEEIQHIYIDVAITKGGVERPRDIERMSGIVSDVQIDTYYCTRILFQRVADDEEVERRTVPADSIDCEGMGKFLAAPEPGSGTNGQIITF